MLDGRGEGPHKSEWINSKGLVHWESDKGKGRAWDLPSLQAVQNGSLDFIITGRLQLDTTWLNTWDEGWPNLWCQMSIDTDFWVWTLLTVFTDWIEDIQLFELKLQLLKGKEDIEANCKTAAKLNFEPACVKTG